MNATEPLRACRWSTACVVVDLALWYVPAVWSSVHFFACVSQPDVASDG